jgi:hypothetical protein
LSANPEVAEVQKTYRDRISRMSIDEYVTGEDANTFINAFDKLFSLHDLFKEKLLLRYEDLIHIPDQFIAEINSFNRLNPSALKKIYEQTRPRDEIDLYSHKRSGKTGQYKHILHPNSVKKLNIMFEGILEKLNYQI